jgi:hypothetical protein
MSQQQTVLRVKTNIPDSNITGATWSSGTTYSYGQVVSYEGVTYRSLESSNVNNNPISSPSYWDPVTLFDTLDLYTDIPIKINKSFSEIQDISKRNSDYTIGLSIPGSKKNNRFFENFFNVDASSLYFDATKRQQIDVLLGDQPLFRGFMKLNKVSVLNSKIEYDITLFSIVADLFGNIGNNLLRDLDFFDTDYTFNHIFSFAETTRLFYQSNFYLDQENPYPYFYPIVHNGYNYETISGATLPNLSGNTTDQTRLYSSTVVGSWTGYTAAASAGWQPYHINSNQSGLRDNQLKPALSIWNLIQLIFKTYGYKVKSDFFNTPWFKSLYLYGYFSSPATKFSYTIVNIQQLPLEGVEVIFSADTSSNVTAIVCKLDTGIPCYCLDEINVRVHYSDYLNPDYYFDVPIAASTSGVTIPNASFGLPFNYGESLNTATADISTLKFLPKKIGETANFVDGNLVDFSVVIDPVIKQIDLLGSIAKKFNLVFIPDPDVANQIIIEPFDFYIGTGKIYDWTQKISYDKGFTVEPAINFIESNVVLTDLDDGDEGNRIFKLQNNRIYGVQNFYGPTDFKTTEKKIETIFSPELIRKWDDNIGLPLGINYSASSQQDQDNQIRWLYKGVKSKPKLMFWSSGFNPFIDRVNEVYKYNQGFSSYQIYMQPSNATGSTSVNAYDVIPSISHTMPMGLADEYKINNDSLCILFNSELPTDVGVQTYNTYTEQDTFNIFYNNRFTNIYDSNTRFVNGYFDLKYADILNLKPQDVIKIQEQYFIVNKIQDFNLTNRELTKVELLQFNVNPQSYPTRYFAYYYCDHPEYCFKIKTDFTNPNMRDTNFIWSIYYDHQVGSLTGSTTGFTSTLRDFRIGPVTLNYIPYTMYEISESQYNTGGCYDFSCDTMMQHFYTNENTPLLFALATFWLSTTGGTQWTGVNVFESCAAFNTIKNTYGILTGSSIYYGVNPCLATPTPTPTPTITPTPTVTPTLTPTPTPTITPTPFPPEFGDGKYIYIQSYYPWVSTDYGATFTQRTTASPRFYKSVCITLDGSRFYGAGATGGGSDKLYLSTNQGVSWSVISTSPNLYWESISCSSNGQYIAGVTSTQGWYFSNDYGATWTLVPNSVGSPATFDWSSVYVNNTGSKQLAGIDYQRFEFDYPKQYAKSLINIGTGSTFTNITTAPLAYWESVCMSDSGQYIGLYGAFSQTGSTDDNRVYISNDYGATFTYKSELSSPDTSKISMSADGKYWVINDSEYFGTGTTRGKIWVSTDYGATFTDKAPNPISGNTYPYYTSAISQNGKTMVVGKANSAPSNPENNKAYISSNYGATFTEITGFTSSTQYVVAISR